jgi:hypothetical protein
LIKSRITKYGKSLWRNTLAFRSFQISQTTINASEANPFRCKLGPSANEEGPPIALGANHECQANPLKAWTTFQFFLLQIEGLEEGTVYLTDDCFSIGAQSDFLNQTNVTCLSSKRKTEEKMRLGAPMSSFQSVLIKPKNYGRSFVSQPPLAGSMGCCCFWAYTRNPA